MLYWAPNKHPTISIITLVAWWVFFFNSFVYVAVGKFVCSHWMWSSVMANNRPTARATSFGICMHRIGLLTLQSKISRSGMDYCNNIGMYWSQGCASGESRKATSPRQYSFYLPLYCFCIDVCNIITGPLLCENPVWCTANTEAQSKPPDAILHHSGIGKMSPGV